jgi:hypothetical protein
MDTLRGRCRHQQAYRDFSANRLSDVIPRRRLLNSGAYAEWFRPAGVEAELEIGIARSRTHTRNFILSRLHGDSRTVTAPCWSWSGRTCTGSTS